MNKLIRFIIEYGLSMLACLSLYILFSINFKIGIIHCFDSQETADTVNKILENLSYSILAAAIFHLFIVALPEYFIKKKNRSIIHGHYLNLQETIRLAKNVVNPFFPELLKTREAYIKYFEDVYLGDPYYIPNTQYPTINDYLLSNQLKVKQQVLELLDMQQYMSHDERDTLISIFNSTYLSQTLIMKEFTEDKANNIPEKPNNQSEIGASLFDLYDTIRNLNL